MGKFFLKWRVPAGVILAVFAIDAVGAQAAAGFSNLSIEELSDVVITSVSKKRELLSDAAASIYVIGREDIRRSGATSIPEVLRLAPNLQVARVDASQYAITARGFNSTTANNLLVLIDGRSVYTPLYSGVFWDVQDVALESVERIEVISGPGGTLWGANAVNGVINIISRHSQETLGALASVGAGTDERNLMARYGGKLGEDGSYRFFAKGFKRDNAVRDNGVSMQDEWDLKHTGFRADWGRANDAVMLEGSLYDGTIDQLVNNDKTISGMHVLGRWNRTLTQNSGLQIQTYYDRSRRIYPGTYGEVLDTFDIDVQHRFQRDERHEVVWGGGYRFSRDDVEKSAALAFLPAQRNLTLANVFVQHNIKHTDNLRSIFGIKLEHNNYTGLEFQPNVRLAWKLPDNALLWSALSRSVRTPSRIDRDIFAPGDPPYRVTGGPNFQSEIQSTLEAGYRVQPRANVLFSASVFYNLYDKLRSIETGAPTILANKLKGNSYGFEMWGSYQVNDWWRLHAGYNYLERSLHTEPDSRDVNSARAGPDPKQQFSLRSTMNLMHNLELDFSVRAIDELPNPHVPGYVTFDARLGWMAAKDVEISLAGFNLLNAKHAEFWTNPRPGQFKRSFYLKTLWKF